jgi:hypothetical protein
LGDGREGKIVFLILILTGGISIPVALIMACLDVLPWKNIDYFEQALRYRWMQLDSSYRWWDLYVFRNYFSLPETLYHAIVFVTLGFVARNRILLSAAGVSLGLYAHPFTGLQLALIVLAYALSSLFLEAKRGPFLALLVLVGLALGCFVCYILFLRTDPAHLDLELWWRHYNQYIILWQYIFAYGPWLLGGLASLLLFPKFFMQTRPWRLVMILALVTFGLMNNHWILSPSYQPAHFSRGYLFVALVLVTIGGYWAVRDRHPAFSRSVGKLGRHPFLLVIFIVFLALDNIFVMVSAWNTGRLNPQTISQDQKEILEAVKQFPGRQTIAVTHDLTIAYLIPVLSKHRSIVGHFANTPFVSKKKDLLRNWVEKGDETLLEVYPYITMAIVDRKTALPAQQWQSVMQNSSMGVYRRIPLRVSGNE